MPAPALTGQDVGEAEGALSDLLQRTLAASNTGVTRTEYIVLRMLATRAPAQSPAAWHAYLAEQPQLGLDSHQAAELLHSLETRALITGTHPNAPSPIHLTPAGAALHATLSEAVTSVTRRLYADLDPHDLAVAHTVLHEVTQRARHLRHEL
jgi:DNA-binding MarR family transcriptional regulator